MKKNDIVTVAIARAQAKLAMPEDKKIAANIQSLAKRLTSAYEKLNDAKAENSDQIGIFQQSVNRLKHEIDNNRIALKQIKADMKLMASKRNNLDNLTADNSSGRISNKH